MEQLQVHGPFHDEPHKTLQVLGRIKTSVDLRTLETTVLEVTPYRFQVFIVFVIALIIFCLVAYVFIAYLHLLARSPMS